MYLYIIKSYPINFCLVLEGTSKNNLEKHSQAVGFLAKDRLLDYTRFCFYVPWLLFCVFLKHAVDGHVRPKGWKLTRKGGDESAG